MQLLELRGHCTARGYIHDRDKEQKYLNVMQRGLILYRLKEKALQMDQKKKKIQKHLDKTQHTEIKPVSLSRLDGTTPALT